MSKFVIAFSLCVHVCVNGNLAGKPLYHYELWVHFIFFCTKSSSTRPDVSLCFVHINISQPYKHDRSHYFTMKLLLLFHIITAHYFCCCCCSFVVVVVLLIVCCFLLLLLLLFLLDFFCKFKNYYAAIILTTKVEFCIACSSSNFVLRAGPRLPS